MWDLNFLKKKPSPENSPESTVEVATEEESVEELLEERRQRLIEVEKIMMDFLALHPLGTTINYLGKNVLLAKYQKGDIEKRFHDERLPRLWIKYFDNYGHIQNIPLVKIDILHILLTEQQLKNK